MGDTLWSTTCCWEFFSKVATYHIPHFKFTMTSIAGDWEMVTDKCPVPVKVTLAELPGMWLMAAMIPKGNMIQCMLRKEGDSFHLENLRMGEKETPIEIVQMEMELKNFLKKGVSKIPREGASLRIEVEDGETMLFQVDESARERLAAPRL